MSQSTNFSQQNAKNSHNISGLSLNKMQESEIRQLNRNKLLSSINSRTQLKQLVRNDSRFTKESFTEINQNLCDVTDPSAGIKFNRDNIERDGGLFNQGLNHSSFIRSPKALKSSLMNSSFDSTTKIEQQQCSRVQSSNSPTASEQSTLGILKSRANFCNNMWARKRTNDKIQVRDGIQVSDMLVDAEFQTNSQLFMKNRLSNLHNFNTSNSLLELSSIGKKVQTPRNEFQQSPRASIIHSSLADQPIRCANTASAQSSPRIHRQSHILMRK